MTISWPVAQVCRTSLNLNRTPLRGGHNGIQLERVMTTYFRFPPVAVLWASDQAHMTLFYIADFFLKHINFFLV